MCATSPDPESAAEAKDVETVLEELGIDAHPEKMIEVWNKLDQVPEDERAELEGRARRARDLGAADALPVSALTGEGCAALLQAIAERVDDDEPLDLELAAGEGEALAWLYRNGRVTGRHDGVDGALQLSVRLDAQARGRFERLFPDAHPRPASEPAAPVIVATGT